MVSMRRYHAFNAQAFSLLLIWYVKNKLNNNAIGTTDFFLNIYTIKLNVPDLTTIYVFKQAPLLLD